MNKLPLNEPAIIDSILKLYLFSSAIELEPILTEQTHKTYKSMTKIPLKGYLRNQLMGLLSRRVWEHGKVIESYDGVH